jgi:hypothetical protein
VGGSVNFWDYPDGSGSGIGNNFLDFDWTVGAAEFALLAEFRAGRYFEGEAILVDYVPVQHIHLGVHECIDGLFDSLYW